MDIITNQARVQSASARTSTNQGPRSNYNIYRDSHPFTFARQSTFNIEPPLSVYKYQIQQRQLLELHNRLEVHKCECLDIAGVFIDRYVRQHSHLRDLTAATATWWQYRQHHALNYLFDDWSGRLQSWNFTIAVQTTLQF